MSFLEKILPFKEAEVKALRARFEKSKPQRPADMPIRDFAAALSGGDRVIAEIKRKSPSHPEFHQAATPATLARSYRRNGAAALSLVIDKTHFGTSLADLAEIKAAVSLPVLVKDFVIDEVQLLHAWSCGADAVLLIVRMLDEKRLKTLLNFAHNLQLHVLVECHDQRDIDQAVAAGAHLIGVNNRNLATLTTSLANGAALMPNIPDQAIKISESGLYSRNDITSMAELGADAFLVGHALLQSRDPGRKVAELNGRESETIPRVKICGITNAQDAQMAQQAGADFLGIIFAEGARQVKQEEARLIRESVENVRLCGVFMDQSLECILGLADDACLDLIQLHGDESPEFCQAVSEGSGLPVVKALVPSKASEEIVNQYSSVAYFLIDLPKGKDQEPATQEQCLQAALNLSASGHDVFLAGGLTPETIIAQRSRLFCIDVSSGVECKLRFKDASKTKSFIAGVKA